MKLRSVRRVVTAVRQLEGGGFEVRRPFPGRDLPDGVDPFLLLDHMGPVDYAPGEAVGAPDHPHRGFETVTYLLDGLWEHEDSVGRRGVLRPGDVQWMTAGDGVVHSEMPHRDLVRDGGRMHGFQLWINLPRKDKRMAPRYQEIPRDAIPCVEQDGVRVRVIAGESLGARAVIDTRTPIAYLHFTLAPGARVAQPVPAGWVAFAYVFAGRARIGSALAREGQAVLLDHDGDAVELTAPDDASGPAELLLLCGEPIREPVVWHGPFVMNTRAEIVEAIRDYQEGRMGRIGR